MEWVCILTIYTETDYKIATKENSITKLAPVQTQGLLDHRNTPTLNDPHPAQGTYCRQPQVPGRWYPYGQRETIETQKFRHLKKRLVRC